MQPWASYYDVSVISAIVKTKCLLWFFLNRKKWKLALIQKWRVIRERVYNKNHGKWYTLWHLLFTTAQIGTFSYKKAWQIEAYVVAYMKLRTNLQLIIYNEFLFITLVQTTLTWNIPIHILGFWDLFTCRRRIYTQKCFCVVSFCGPD